MKKTILIIVCLILPIFAMGLTTEISGTINSDSTWSVDNTGDIVITGNVTIGSGVTVTIGPLVNVMFNANTSIIVKGTLNARHSQFMSNQGTITAGDWNYIQIGDYYNAGTAVFDTCTIRDGGGNNNYGNIWAYNGTVSINGCDIQNSQSYGMSVEINADVTIQNTNIFSNDWPMVFRNETNVTFLGENNFTGNTHDGIYLNYTNQNADVFLDTINVPYVILNDYWVRSGTLDISPGSILKFAYGDGLFVEGKLVADAPLDNPIIFTAYTDDNHSGDTNDDGAGTTPSSSYWEAVYFKPDSDPTSVLRNCDLSYAGYGYNGAVTIENASPTVDSCRLANNYYGLKVIEGSSPVLSNNIMSASQKVPIALSFDADPVFENNSFSFSDNEYDAIGLLDGTLTKDAHLPVRNVTEYDNVTYLMLGTVTVPETKTLTIDKGVVIKSYYYYHRLIIQGKLTAVGTADSMITFTSVKDDVYGNPMDTNKDGTQSTPGINDWAGIIFENSSDDNSVMDYCRVKYASLNNYWYSSNNRYLYDGAITLINASPQISNSEIKNVDYGIYAVEASNPQILNNTFTNSTYTPIAMSVSADPTFSGNTFENTSWTALGLLGEDLGFSGTIKVRDVAGYDNISYVLLSDLKINSGTYVTVDPGVVIKMNGCNIDVEGGLTAQSLAVTKSPEVNPIIFTSVKDDNWGNPGDTNGDGNASSPGSGNWGSIIYRGSSDDAFNILDNCQFNYGGGRWTSNYYYSGTVTAEDADITLRNSIISDSHYYGFTSSGSSFPLVENVDIRNSRYDPISISLKSNPVLSNISFTGNGSSGIKIIEGTLSSDATLHQRNVAGISNIAYIVENLVVGADAVLTIEPGVVIKSVLSYYNTIKVEGALVAEGTEAAPIIFTSLKDDSNGGDTNNDGNTTSPEKSNWRGLEFVSSSLDSLNILKHASVRYGGGYSYYTNYYDGYGAVRIYNTFVKIDSSVIEQSGNTGIGIYGSANPIISNNEIINISSTPISMSMFATPVFENNFITNLGLTAIGIVPENYSVNATVPLRDFGGYENITYYTFNASTINSGTTITIQEGTVYKTNNTNILNVDGTLIVDGTPESPVIFTDYRDDELGNPFDTNNDGSGSEATINYYSAIYFNDVSDDDNSIISQTIIKYFKYGIDLQQASPSIQHCDFENDEWGIKLNGVSEPSVDYCSFTDLKYTPMLLSLVSYPVSTIDNSIFGSTYKAIGILEETLSQEITLPRRDFGGITNIPYYFTGNYTIGSSASLTIEPGVILKFNYYSKLKVKKSLIAEGGAESDSTIVFTSIKDDFYGGDTNSDSTDTQAGNRYSDQWNGIVFEDESLDPLCRLDHTVIKYTGYYNNNDNAAINVISASPTITNSLIINNVYGLVAKGASNPVINFCDIYNNTYYGVYNDDGSFNIDATNNWWGDNSGPVHTSNPDGTGDIISDYVNYAPYLQTNASLPISGDVSLNGKIQAYDGSLILQSAASLLTLSSLQEMVADVSGEAGVSAFDASLVLQYVVGTISFFPVELSSSTSVKNTEDMERTQQILSKLENVHAELSLEDVIVENNDLFTLALHLENISNVSAIDLRLKFDSHLFQLHSIEKNDLFSSMNLEYSLSDDGIITIALASADMINSGGKVADLHFTVREIAHGTNLSSISVEKCLINEKDMTAFSKSADVTVVGLPESYSLSQNYPNPFNGGTVISFDLPETVSNLRIDIYNMLGEKVKTLTNTSYEAGNYSVTWFGANDSGIRVSSGIYFYVMKADQFQDIKKLHLIK